MILIIGLLILALLYWGIRLKNTNVHGKRGDKLLENKLQNLPLMTYAETLGAVALIKQSARCDRSLLWFLLLLLSVFCGGYFL